MNFDQTIAHIRTARAPADLFDAEPARAAGMFPAGSRIAEGDLADIYTVGAAAVLKLVRSPGAGALAAREATALRRLHASGDPRLAARVPRLIAACRYRTGPAERHATILERADGFMTLSDVRAARPGGVAPEDVAWVWRRLLNALDLAHQAGIVHGAVLPEHVLINFERRDLMLVDWCYSAPVDGPVAAVVTRRAAWYPAEVVVGAPARPETDVAMATRCMAYLMEGSPHRPLWLFAEACVLGGPYRRPTEGWDLLHEFDELLAAHIR